VKYLLDTSAVVALVNGERELLALLREHEPPDFAISSVAAFELYFGAFKSSRVEANVARIDALRLPFVEFDREDAREAGLVRSRLAKLGTPIGPYDVLIAGQARARDLAVVTRNVREFARVPGLQLETWATGSA
jgi:tRNA(fMet)-specific endonuclease VapC